MPHGQNSTQSIRLHAAGGFVNLAKEIGQRFNRVFGTLVMMCGIVARRNGVHVLAIKLEAVESPLAQDFANKRLVIFDDAPIGRT